MLTALTALLFAVADAQQPCIPPDLQATTTMAREAVFAGTAPEVAGVVAQAEANVACLSGWTDPDELAAFFQAGGTIAALSLDAEAAHERFASAARLAGGVPFDDTLGLVHEPVYLEAAQRVLQGPHGTVAARTDVRVDGWILRFGEQRSVPAGWHLVQYTGPDGRIVTERVEVEGDASLLVGPEPPPRPYDLACTEPTFTKGQRTALVTSGGLTLAAGVGLLVAGGFQLEQLGRAKGSGMTPKEQQPIVTTARAYGYGGLAATALGAGLLLAPAVKVQGGEIRLGLGPFSLLER